jgi:hypothetical protein
MQCYRGHHGLITTQLQHSCTGVLAPAVLVTWGAGRPIHRCICLYSWPVHVPGVQVGECGGSNHNTVLKVDMCQPGGPVP